MTIRQLPSGWRDLPLKNICTFEYGSSLAERNRRPGSIPIFGSSGVVGTHDEALIEGPVIIVGRKGNAGAVHFSDGPCWPIDTAYFIRPPEGLSTRWLFYALRWLDLPASDSTTAIPSLSREVAYRLSVPVPPLGEQRRIAQELDAAMAEVGNTRRSIAVRHQDCGSLWLQAINGALGGRAIAAAEDAGSDWTPITGVARLESGHTPSRRHPEWWGGDIPWIALPDIRNLDGKTVYETSERTNELGLANSSARLLPEGTVVLSRTASVGFVTVMGRPMATSQDFVNWVPGPKLRPWFLAYALIGARDYLRELSSGAVHKTIYMPTLKNLHIRLPALTDQDRALEQIRASHETLRAAMTALEQQNTAVEALPQALLSAAFTGEL